MHIATGTEIVPYIPRIADLRISLFREFPYLYDGDVEYERGYLKTYAESGSSLTVLILDEDRLVGVSTGLPLMDADEEFQEPFLSTGEIDPEAVFYFGESLLLDNYRGQGIGHVFFDEREKHAMALGYTITAFCAVDRPADHPLRPTDYRPLDEFWIKRGYSKRPDLIARYPWKDLGEENESAKPMIFWVRTW